jgi:hypothetical protein
MKVLNIKADITYEFSNQPHVNFSDQLNFIPFEKNKISRVSKIKLDGKLKDWNEEWYAISNWEGKPFDYDGKNDCEVRFSTGYDDDFVYVAMQITDEEIFTDEEISYWQQDAIVFGLDARPEHISAFNKGEGRGRDWVMYLRTFKEDKPVYGEEYLPVKIESAVKKTDQGMDIELAIPIEYLDKVQGRPWKNLRLGIGYYDFDSSGSEQTTHFWYPAWNTKDDIPGSGMFFKE